MIMRTDWNFSLSDDDILRGQGVDPDVIKVSRPRLMAAVQRAQTQGLGLIHPISLTQEVAIRTYLHENIVLENGVVLTGPLVTQHLAGAERVVAAICTIGPEHAIIKTVKGTTMKAVYLFATLKKSDTLWLFPFLSFEKAGSITVWIGTERTVINIAKFVAALKFPIAASDTKNARTMF